VLVVCWWCVGGVLVVCWWCVGGVLVVCWWCVGGILIAFWRCQGGAKLRGAAGKGRVPAIAGVTVAHLAVHELNTTSAKGDAKGKTLLRLPSDCPPIGFQLPTGRLPIARCCTLRLEQGKRAAGEQSMRSRTPGSQGGRSASRCHRARNGLLGMRAVGGLFANRRVALSNVEWC
jgi:hypothetical protein